MPVRVAVAVLLLVEVGVARNRLEDQGDEKEPEEGEREAVVPDEGAHAQLCSTPITTAAAMPAAISAR